MKNKKLVITLVIIILILIGGLIYLLNKMYFQNKQNEEPKNEVKVTLVDYKYFTLKKGYSRDDTELIGITSDGTEKVLYSFTFNGWAGKVSYNYSKKDNKIYIGRYYYESEGQNKSELDFIDLNVNESDYKLEKLADIDIKDSTISNVAKVGYYLYFTAIKFPEENLYRINIKTKELDDMNKVSDKYEMTLLSYNDEKLIYNINSDIYLFDSKNNTSEKIAENSYSQYIYNDLLIYYTYVDHGNYIYYSYDFNTKEKSKISAEMNSGEMGVDNIVPYKNGFMSVGQATRTSLVFNGIDDEILSITCDDINNYNSELNCNKLGGYNFTIKPKNLLYVKAEVLAGEEVKNENNIISYYNITYDMERKKIIGVTESKDNTFYYYSTYLY